MPRPLRIAPSILASDFSKLAEEVRAVEAFRQAQIETDAYYEQQQRIARDRTGKDLVHARHVAGDDRPAFVIGSGSTGAVNASAPEPATNAEFSKALVKPKDGERWVLVTSAFHMPRSVGLFRKAQAAGRKVSPQSDSCPAVSW